MSINMKALRSRNQFQRPNIPANSVNSTNNSAITGGTNNTAKTYQPLRGPGGPRIMVIRNAVQNLDLPPAQKDRMEFLTRESEQVIRESWEPVSGKIQRELRTLESRILESLEPSQRPAFRELLKKRPFEIRSGATNALSSERTSTNNSNTNN
jgi:hypothetical protein